MTRSIRFAGLAALVLLSAGILSACGSGVQFVRQDMTQYPPKPSDAPIEIHEGGIMQPHVVIGTMTAERTMKATFNDRSTYDEVMAALEDYARKLGADALVDVHPTNDADGELDTKVRISATAVRFLQQGNTVTSDREESGEGATGY